MAPRDGEELSHGVNCTLERILPRVDERNLQENCGKWDFSINIRAGGNAVLVGGFMRTDMTLRIYEKMNYYGDGPFIESL